VPSEPGPSRLALVTGANRGIGFEICRQLAHRGIRVLLTARDERKGQEAAARLRQDGLDVQFHQLDVTDPESVRRLTGAVAAGRGAADILVNNAAVYPDEDTPGLTIDLDTVRQTMEVNAYGPLRLCQALIPLMRRRRYGRVVNVSSGAGSLAEMTGGTLAYRVSKATLNAITRILADEVRGSGILINAMCPGWVRTEMGGRSAPRSVEEGADTAVFLATLPADGPTGGFFRDRKPIPW
jgi:NAD(P)-dependent dehydrogenase (short-subunit alcohol dehydrogenase family)